VGSIGLQGDLHSRGFSQRLGLVGLLPGELRQLAAEVAVAGRYAIDRPPQIERADDPLRRQTPRINEPGE